ncbi:sulfatase-like hydrolase/transferase [Carboxylicivirga sp. A043]|uniref:sulfatase family protein n=1 Tax=Carboxylicivirga litoralis TaxID=2816963 RepID=UPI0021CAEDDE|nr:sulfatase-like hydrolase/transferase [Carboxylicivirga sp. A043]MCU4155382.1 sulfatase-like hydrolase/transferase [Carboxylicivirga sp. A043]
MLQRLLIALCLLGLYTGSVTAQNKRPNVIIVLTDDQGSIDMNCYGATDLYTPNMDALAESGVQFNQFYVAAPVCSPSRASMLTGQNPHKAGLPGNASSQEGHEGMPAEKITIAEIMKEEGYKTAHIGKWHIGYTPETMPLGQGFDYSFGHMGGCIDNYSHFFYWNGPNRHDLWENGQEVWHDGAYFGDLMAEKADRYIKEHKDQPFFMYYAINMPHYPLQPKGKWRDYYQHLEMPRRDYAAFVSTIDEYIGQLISTLEEEGIRDNTIVILQSDHGHSNETRTFGGGGNAGPYRGSKFSLFEGGIRVPAIISYPDKIKPGQQRQQMAFNIDWLPTVADYCDISSLPDAIEGLSLRKVIEKNSASEHEQFIWKSGGSWAIRKGDWKLLGYPQDNSGKGTLNPDEDFLFLSNIKTDHSEMKNLASQYPQKVKELTADYLQWAFASPDDIPQKRATIHHKAVGKQIELLTSPHAKYKANGASTLIDGKTGSHFYNDGAWLGYEKSDAELVIDFGESIVLNEIKLNAMHNPEAWIFLPQELEVSWSNDNKTFSAPIKKRVAEPKQKNNYSQQQIVIQQEDVHARYLRITVKNIGVCPDWHKGKGHPSWLFIDEVIIN